LNSFLREFRKHTVLVLFLMVINLNWLKRIAHQQLRNVPQGPLSLLPKKMHAETMEK